MSVRGDVDVGNIKGSLIALCRVSEQPRLHILREFLVEQLHAEKAPVSKAVTTKASFCFAGCALPARVSVRQKESGDK